MRLSRHADVVVVALATLIGSVAFTWPLGANLGGSLPALGDALYNAWILGWVADRTSHLLAGVWNAPSFFPYPSTLAYAEPLIGIAVPLAPVYWLTHNALLLHNVAVYASFVVAGTGGYLLGRDITGRRSAGLVSAAFAAFVPYRLSHLPHIQVLMDGWLWWTVWSLHRYFDRPSTWRAIRVAIFYALLGLSSAYWAYIGLLPLATVGLIECWRRRPALGRVMLHGAAAVLVCAAAFLPPAYHLRQLTSADSPIGSTIDSQSYSADLLDYVTGRPQLWIWGSALRHGNGEMDLFPGVTAIACALLVLGWPRSRVDRGAWGLVYAGLAIVAVILSLGPAPAYRGHELAKDPVFSFLTAYLPGFAQLRVPGRFVVVAQLALSVLAARGVAAWLGTRHAGRREGALTAALLVSLIYAEGLGLPVHVEAFSPYPGPRTLQVSGDRLAYAWLLQAPAGAAIELPLDGWGRTHYSQIYQYRTLLHGHRIVNGVARFGPPLPVMLSDPDSPLVAPERMVDGVAFLRGLGVRYVVIHPSMYIDPALGEGVKRALVEAGGRPTADFGDVSILDLGGAEPLLDTTAVELPRSVLAVSASSGDAAAMVDGDSATRWLSGHPQDGTDWIAAELPGVTAISGVRLQLGGRSLNDYPRGLEVSVSTDREHFVPVFAGSVAGALGAGIRRHPSAPVIELRWPAAAARVVRVRQAGAATRIWFWSVHELRLLTDPGPR